VVGLEQRLRWDTCTYSRPWAAGVDGSDPGAGKRRLDCCFYFSGMTVEAAVLRAPCELTLAHTPQGGIPADPTGQGRLCMYESRYTTLLSTSSHPHHRQDSELPTGEHIISAFVIEESSTVLVPHTSCFIERPERGLFAHGAVSCR